MVRTKDEIIEVIKQLRKKKREINEALDGTIQIFITELTEDHGAAALDSLNDDSTPHDPPPVDPPGGGG